MKMCAKAKTKVAFKIEVNPYTKEREVFAFFPELSTGPTTRTAYSHVGQHSDCEQSYFARRKWATYPEYIDLYHELLDIGYGDLEVLNADFGDYDEDGCYIADAFGLEVNSIEAKIS
jgi:hypothetical protein